MLPIFGHPAYNQAPAEQVANWLTVDVLRHTNIDEICTTIAEYAQDFSMEGPDEISSNIEDVRKD